MKRSTPILFAVALAALAVGAYFLFPWSDTSSATNTALPAPIAALSARGLEVADKFDAPSGLTGYAATFQGKPIAIYLTDDKQHAIVGTMIDAQGKDITTELLQRIVSGPQAEKAWAQLESAAWVRDGSKDAETVIYEFTDPNCPYCHKFWQAARPWVEAGQVQIRHVLVGVIKPDSVPKAATILAADNPEAALTRNEHNFQHGGIKIADNIPDTARQKVAANSALMESLGYFATPTILYQTKNGEIGVKQGMPQGAEIQKIFGGPKP